MQKENNESTECLLCEFIINYQGFSPLLKITFPSTHLSLMLSPGALHMHFRAYIALWLEVYSLQPERLAFYYMLRSA